MYERTFGTDWETIDDPEEVIERAFALGVAARFGDEYPGELARLSEQIDTTYDRSLANLAYQKGRNQVDAVDADEEEAVWRELVDETALVDPNPDSPDVEFDEEDDADVDTIPPALRRIDIDTLPDDSTDRVARPSFLDEPGSRARSRGRPAGERTVFGRSTGRGKRGRTDRSDAESDAGPDAGADSNDPGERGNSGGHGRSDTGGERTRSNAADERANAEDTGARSNGDDTAGTEPAGGGTGTVDGDAEPAEDGSEKR